MTIFPFEYHFWHFFQIDIPLKSWLWFKGGYYFCNISKLVGCNFFLISQYMNFHSCKLHYCRYIFEWTVANIVKRNYIEKNCKRLIVCYNQKISFIQLHLSYKLWMATLFSTFNFSFVHNNKKTKATFLSFGILLCPIFWI